MIDHLSFSSVKAYHLCPRSWKMHYIDKIPSVANSSLFFGSVFHKVIEAYITACATGKTNQTLGTAELLKLWSQEWKKKLEEESEVDWGDDEPERLNALGARMLGGKFSVTGGGPNREQVASDFLAGIVPRMNGSKPEIERKVNLSVPGVPVPVIGFIDIITADGVPADFKTSGKSWYQEKANAELQPLFYLAALAQMGEPVPDGKFRFFVFTKTSQPKAQILEAKRTAGEIFWLLDHIRQTWESIQAGIFPTRAGTFKCRPRRKANGDFNNYWCEYWPICRGRFK